MKANITKAPSISGPLTVNGRTNEANISKPDVVSNYILERIQRRELRSGDKLPTEPELCALTGVSRTSVREAIKRLEALSIVEIKRGEGTFISKPEEVSFTVPFTYKMLLSDIKFSELLRFREMIEFGVMRCAIENITDKELENLKELNETFMRSAKEPLDSQLLYEKDYAFHNYLGDVCGNSILANLYRYTYEAFGSFVTGNYDVGMPPSRSYELHSLMIQGLERKDLFLSSYVTTLGNENWAYWIGKQTSGEYYFMPNQKGKEM